MLVGISVQQRINWQSWSPVSVLSDSGLNLYCKVRLVSTSVYDPFKAVLYKFWIRSSFWLRRRTFVFFKFRTGCAAWSGCNQFLHPLWNHLSRPWRSNACRQSTNGLLIGICWCFFHRRQNLFQQIGFVVNLYRVHCINPDLGETGAPRHKNRGMPKF